MALAMSRGLSAVCATCKRYWEARERNIPGDVCTTKTRCGSPISGDTFSNYDGPLKSRLSDWCFVCAQPSEFALRVGAHPRLVGACKTHVGFVAQFRAVGGATAQIELRNSNGLVSSSAPPKKTLMQAISEYERANPIVSNTSAGDDS